MHASSAATSVYPMACRTGATIVMNGAMWADPMAPPIAIWPPVLMRFIGWSISLRLFMVGVVVFFQNSVVNVSFLRISGIFYSGIFRI